MTSFAFFLMAGLMAVLIRLQLWQPGQAVVSDHMYNQLPRRYSNYLPEDGFTTLNQVSTLGAMLLALSRLPFLWNVWKSRLSPRVMVDDPWGLRQLARVGHVLPAGL
jgi:heme/copper-type cytochrome/quinol oxidase subunit 1